MSAQKGIRLGEGLNRDRGFISMVAMLTMLVDHVGVVLLPGVMELRLIGRIAFPLFCYGIVTGFEFTRDWRRYALRLAVLGVLTQPFFMLALRHGLMELNVLATLLLGLLSIAGIRERRYGSHIWAPVICLVISAVQPMDYGWRGVLLIQLMYLARESRGGFAAVFLTFCLYWGAGSSEIRSLFGRNIRPDVTGSLNGAVSMFFSLIRTQALAILALPFMIRPTGTGLRIPRWLTYSWYPGHLLALWLISQAI